MLPQVVVRTSSERGAGTDAEPYLELCAPSGATSGRRALRCASAGAFARDAVDGCTVTCTDLGPELAACVVGHDGRGEAPGWHLEQVRRRVLAGAAVLFCYCP